MVISSDRSENILKLMLTVNAKNILLSHARKHQMVQTPLQSNIKTKLLDACKMLSTVAFMGIESRTSTLST